MKKSKKVVAWKNRIVEHGEQPANQYLAHELNARRHPAKQRSALRGSLDTLGWVAPVLVSARTGKILDGHARVEEALSQDENAPVPFIKVDVTEGEEATILATIDPITNLATYERESLDALLREVNVGDASLQQMLNDLANQEGLYLGEISETEDSDNPEILIDRAAQLNEKWKVKAGDLWIIGKHRLLCGDSTKAEDVKKVLENNKPLLMVTDPPYGVEYDPAWRFESRLNTNKKGSNKLGKVLNDDRADWTESWQLFPGNVAYVYHAGLMTSTVQASLEAAGFEVRSQIIWAKDRMAMSRGDYHWKHEPCWYAVRKGEPSRRTDDRTQTTVWNIPSREDAGHGHGTQKPVECMARAIRNHTGDVYEPFAGSGTTLVAAQNLNRRCYAIELSPNYCAVILERLSTTFPNIEVQLNV